MTKHGTREQRADFDEKIAGIGQLEIPVRAAPAESWAQAAAERGAGRTTPGTEGVSMNQAGDFIARMLAAQAAARAQTPGPAVTGDGEVEGG